MKLFFLSLIFLPFIALAGKSYQQFYADAYHPKPVTQIRTLKNFDSIRITAPIAVKIIAGTKGRSVKMRGLPFDLKHLVVEVRNRQLVIHSNRTFIFNGNVTTEIQVPSLSALVLAGGAHATVQHVKSKNLKVEVYGNASLHMEGHKIGLNFLHDTSTAAVTIRHIHTRALDVDAENNGPLHLSGKVVLNNLRYVGNGNVYISHLAKAPLSIWFQGNGHVILRGEILLKNLYFDGTGWLDAFWVGNTRLKILGKGNGHVCLAGIARLLEVELHDHAVLDARFVRANTVAVKAFGDSIAYVYPLINLYSYAVHKGQIFVLNDPQFYSELFKQSGDILLVDDIPESLTDFYRPKKLYE